MRTPKKNDASRTHILDFLILVVTYLCIMIIHSHSYVRRRPIRNTLTLGISHLVSICKPSHLSAQQPSKIQNKLYLDQSTSNHVRHRTQPRTMQPQVSMWHMPRGSSIEPVRGCVRHLQHLALHHLHAPTNRFTTSPSTVYHAASLNSQAASLAPLPEPQ